MINRPLTCVASVSGIRGVIGQTLDPEQVLGLAAAFGRAIAQGGTVVLGRDSRPTGPTLAEAATAGLMGVGCEVIDIGVVPTPTVPLMVGHLQAAGGIQISASHNPVEWNALKFYTASGRNIDQAELDVILAVYAEPEGWADWQGCGHRRADDQAPEIHAWKIVSVVDVDLIRAARFTVVIDSVNGSGANLAPMLLERLGCRVVPIFCRPDLVFPRDPEPTAANVTATGAVVKAVGADLGFVQDPDADRLAIIDENGTYIGEEYTLVLCAASRLATEKAAGGTNLTVCTNLSTSRMLDEVATRLGGRVVRTKVGEANVIDAMQAENALIGGEGNGGVIDPRVVMCRDSQVGMALVLELLARRRKSLSHVVAGIPRFAMHKEKVAMDRDAVEAAISRLKSHALAKGAQVDERDGLKLIWADRWAHLRASGTETISRVITEAPTAAEAADLAGKIRQAVGAKVVEEH
jgi:phosphomannomutase